MTDPNAVPPPPGASPDAGAATGAAATGAAAPAAADVAAGAPGGETASAPPAELVRSPLSDGAWHRLHPLTPLLRGGLALLVVLGVVVANMRDRLIAIFVPAFAPDAPVDDWEDYEAAGDPISWVLANNLILIALLITLGVLALIIGGFYLSWRFHTFRITDDDVEVRSGILSRTQRRAPLDRVQGVNLTRPAIARLLGAAKLEIVGAGADANVKLEYLSTGNAETIRADILRLASGRRLAESRAAAAGGTGRHAVTDTVARGISGLIEGDDSDAAEPASVVRIPAGRLIGSQAASWGTVMILAGATALAIAISQGVFWVLFAYFPALLGLGAYWIRTIVRSLRYSIAPTRDGVRVTFGLFTTVSEILPPGRIHAVEVSQSILWRGFGWWTVRINRMTGRSAADTTTDQFTTVLPVGTLADVERVLGLILPSIGEAERAAIIGEGVLGSGRGDATADVSGGYVTTPRRARILRPLSWRRNGLAIAGDLLLLRRGIVWRRLAVLPLARMQSMALQQGPIDRALRVATLRAHTVTGPVIASVTGIDRDDAIASFERIAAVAVSAAASDRSHRWAEVSASPESVFPVSGAAVSGAVSGADVSGAVSGPEVSGADVSGAEVSGAVSPSPSPYTPSPYTPPPYTPPQPAAPGRATALPPGAVPPPPYAPAPASALPPGVVPPPPYTPPTPAPTAEPTQMDASRPAEEPFASGERPAEDATDASGERPAEDATDASGGRPAAEPTHMDAPRPAEEPFASGGRPAGGPADGPGQGR